jgi:hypothetical protein
VTSKEVTHHNQVKQVIEGHVYQLRWPSLLLYPHNFSTKLSFSHFLINSIRKKPTIRRMHTNLPSIPHITKIRKKITIIAKPKKNYKVMIFHINKFLLYNNLLIVVVSDKYFDYPLGFYLFFNNGHHIYCISRIGNNIPSHLRL